MRKHLASFLTIFTMFAWSIFVWSFVASAVFADVKLPAIIGDNMVLQRGHANAIWGWADPGEEITVEFNEQTHKATADDSGKWSVRLRPMRQGGPFEMKIAGKNEQNLKNILIGDVWVCSGQSNMEWSVKNSNDKDNEIANAKYPNIRLITVPKASSSTPKDNFNGSWTECSPETVPNFSAVAYFFGRQVHQETKVPIGLIHTSWGGSSCETWINPEVVAQYKMFGEIMNRKANVEKEKPNGGDNQQAGYLYNGMIVPIKAYGIKGAIWYQGETNAGRAYQYRTLFPLMIQNWREEWGQGDFPFYFVQLANFMDVSAEPQESAWAELREAQSMTAQSLRNTGEAVIIDIGEAKDIHPRNKQDVGLRLALLALNRDYRDLRGGRGGEFAERGERGERTIRNERRERMDREREQGEQRERGERNERIAQRMRQGFQNPSEGPRFQSMMIRGEKAFISYRQGTASGLKVKEGEEVKGFAVAGADRKFYWATAKIVENNRVEVSCPEVPHPVAVRYAWANNPVCNLYNVGNLPACPFRTDMWPGVTINNQ